MIVEGCQYVIRVEILHCITNIYKNVLKELRQWHMFVIQSNIEKILYNDSLQKMTLMAGGQPWPMRVSFPPFLNRL